MEDIAVYRCQLVREGEFPLAYGGAGKVGSPEQIVNTFNPYFKDLDREHFCVLMLTTANQPIGFNTVSIGTLNASFALPREVFKPAILSSAARVVLMHNHPSGDTTVSDEDIAITVRLCKAGELLGISVLDHIIFGQGYVSMLKNQISPFGG